MKTVEKKAEIYLKGWKPTSENRIKELQKAETLIAAEIDRLQNLK